jgi:hypothetical protein
MVLIPDDEEPLPQAKGVSAAPTISAAALRPRRRAIVRRPPSHITPQDPPWSRPLSPRGDPPGASAGRGPRLGGLPSCYRLD